MNRIFFVSFVKRNLSIAMGKSLLIFSLISITIFACKPNEIDSSEVSTQGMFEFPGAFMSDDDGNIPAYLDPDKILCNGKGIRVANCISRQLQSGICLGIIKHHKRVYAIEIPCDNIKKAEVDSIHIESMIY
ncbi:MAG: hypothetical protein ACJA01_002804 [Saprospiraceae bacterium]|jgi:hypothetical protein